MSKVLQNAPQGAFCNTFDHLATICLCFVCFEWLFYTGFTVYRFYIFQHSVVFHAGLYCLPKYPFRGFQYAKDYIRNLNEDPYRKNVNSEIFANILFSRIALKEYVRRLKFVTKAWFTYISKLPSDFAILQGFYFHETSAKI